MTLRVAIVDDEPVARRRMRRMLRREPDVDVVAESGDGRAAIEAIGTHRPDLVFLDVQMPEFDGFEVVREIGTGFVPAIVFVTAFDQYALRAFEVHAIDYLLKPFTPERLHQAVEQARARLGTRGREAATDPRLAALLDEFQERGRYLQRIPVRAGARIVILNADDVDWIQAADNYVLFHASGREYLMRETLVRLEQELDPRQFVRIHRSALVRLDRIGEMLPSVHGDFRVTLKTGVQLTLSRYYRERVERVLRRPL
jgi:two-component system, LytTR family, response regulator